jgi:hypothetical protein
MRARILRQGSGVDPVYPLERPSIVRSTDLAPYRFCVMPILHPTDFTFPHKAPFDYAPTDYPPTDFAHTVEVNTQQYHATVQTVTRCSLCSYPHFHPTYSIPRFVH